MAAGDIIWADGMESGAVSTYNSNAGYSTTYSRIANSGAGVRFTSADGHNAYNISVFNQTYEEIIFGVAFQTATTVYNNRILNVITFHDGANPLTGSSTSYQCGLYVSLNGSLVFATKTCAAVSVAHAASPPATILANNWYWIDGKIRFNNTNGNYEYRVNGSVIASGYNIDTCSSANNYTKGAAIANSDTDTNFNQYFDDLYIMDNTGRTQDYLGDIRVYDIVPSGDAFYNGLVPSTGTSHYAMVDDGLTVNDADYLSTTVSGIMDSFLYTPLPSPVADITAIHGVMHANRVRKTDAGIKTVRVLQRQGGVTYERPGSDKNLTNTFNYYFYPETVNPATSSDWTVQEVNTLEAGIKVEV